MSTVFRHPAPGQTGEPCQVCSADATHKVGEETAENRHNFTSYLCCEHFGLVMGPLAERWCGGNWP